MLGDSHSHTLQAATSALFPFPSPRPLPPIPERKLDIVPISSSLAFRGPDGNGGHAELSSCESLSRGREGQKGTMDVEEEDAMGKEEEGKETMDISSLFPSARLRDFLHDLYREDVKGQGDRPPMEEQELAWLGILKDERDGGEEGKRGEMMYFRVHLPIVCARSLFIKEAAARVLAAPSFSPRPSASSSPFSPASRVIIPLPLRYSARGSEDQEIATSESVSSHLPPLHVVFETVLYYLYTDELPSLHIEAKDRYESPVPVLSSSFPLLVLDSFVIPRLFLPCCRIAVPSILSLYTPSLFCWSLLLSHAPLSGLFFPPSPLPTFSLYLGSISDAMLDMLPFLEALLIIAQEMEISRLFTLVEARLKEVIDRGRTERAMREMVKEGKGPRIRTRCGGLGGKGSGGGVSVGHPFQDS